MIQEIRIYDIGGEKRFIKIDTEIFVSALSSGTSINLNRAFESAIVQDGEFYQPPHRFTIEVGLNSVPFRAYEHVYYNQRERRNQRVYTRLGALVERIEIACARWLDR